MNQDENNFELLPTQLRAYCDPALLAEPASDHPINPGEVGQARALEAIDFALEMSHPGYNLFVVAEAGSGRGATVRARIEQLAQRRKVPHDLSRW